MWIKTRKNNNTYVYCMHKIVEINIIEECNGKFHICTNSDYGSFYSLGEYTTLQQANDILEEILSDYDYGVSTYTIPEDKENYEN
mgnify:CR=1 FL=1